MQETNKYFQHGDPQNLRGTVIVYFRNLDKPSAERTVDEYFFRLLKEHDVRELRIAAAVNPLRKELHEGVRLPLILSSAWEDAKQELYYFDKKHTSLPPIFCAPSTLPQNNNECDQLEITSRFVKPRAVYAPLIQLVEEYIQSYASQLVGRAAKDAQQYLVESIRMKMKHTDHSTIDQLVQDSRLFTYFMTLDTILDDSRGQDVAQKYLQLMSAANRNDPDAFYNTKREVFKLAAKAQSNTQDEKETEESRALQFKH